MTRAPRQVALDHIDAVLAGDPTRMAADYSIDAVLERPGATYRGHSEVEAYFETVPDRLGPARVVFDDMSVDGAVVTFRWHLEGSESASSGVDVCTIQDGAIVHQIVRLGSDDF